MACTDTSAAAAAVAPILLVPAMEAAVVAATLVEPVAAAAAMSLAVKDAESRKYEEGELTDDSASSIQGGQAPPRLGAKRPHGHADGRWAPPSPAGSACSGASSASSGAWPWKHHSSGDSSGGEQAVPTMDMPMEFWVRGEECKRLKTEHLDFIDSHYSSREQFIEDTVFTDPMTGEVRDTVLEPNMFPYQTPPDVEHWTLWSRSDMTHEEIQAWVTEWLMVNKPHVRRWNYDDNAGDRSIYWFHVHVYIQYDDPSHARPRIAGDEKVEREAEERSRYKRSRRSRSPAVSPDPFRRRRRFADVKSLQTATAAGAGKPAAE
ncbi:hypothetical protein JKP88DRAFT_232906 [Tribonema minus]|uniref:Uncharacterized protein n=1 Tax=Tribonema minus TaxID=303371 RepID=A0A836CLJ2_9STRA|nr:hypothetical protein JKP88DRAFT_232906 [Tribonema minus]